MTQDMKKIAEIIALAKSQGLKRLKVGSIEVEISNYELTVLYTAKLGLNAGQLTDSNMVQETPSPTSEAKDTTQTMLDTTLTPEDWQDEDLLFLSST